MKSVIGSGHVRQQTVRKNEAEAVPHLNPGESAQALRMMMIIITITITKIIIIPGLKEDFYYFAKIAL